MSLSYTTEAINAIINTDEVIVKEFRDRNGNFHTLNIELKALQQGAPKQETPMGPVTKGAILGRAMEALEKAGYTVQERSGYPGRRDTNGRREFVAWPHLAIQDPNVGTAAVNQAQATAATIAAKMAMVSYIGQTNRAAANKAVLLLNTGKIAEFDALIAEIMGGEPTDEPAGEEVEVDETFGAEEAGT